MGHTGYIVFFLILLGLCAVAVLVIFVKSLGKDVANHENEKEE